jgi:hypothetical protein
VATGLGGGGSSIAGGCAGAAGAAATGATATGAAVAGALATVVAAAGADATGGALSAGLSLTTTQPEIEVPRASKKISALSSIFMKYHLLIDRSR